MASKDLIIRLGSFLADVTMDRPAARIHAELRSRVEQTWPNTDPQLAQVYAEESDFATIWAAIRTGSALPEASWDRVVLPAVVFYSTGDLIKTNLETALHLWTAARNAPPDSLPTAETARLRVTVPAALAAVPAVVDAEVVDRPLVRHKRASWRWWVPVVAAACAGLMLFAFTRGEQNALGDNVPSGSPSTSDAPVLVLPMPSVSEPIPSMEPPPPSVSPSPSRVPPKPSPATSWSAAPVVDPSAPQNLRVVSTSRRSIGLAWDSPASWGSGGFDHYRVFRDGADLGPTVYSGKTVSYLTPGRAYTFEIRAYNKAGRESPPSNTLAASTDPWPAPVITTNPDHNDIELGRDIDVRGNNIPCDVAAEVHILLGQQLVTTARTSGNDSGFDARIDIFEDSGSHYFRIPPSDSWVELTAGPWQLTVRLPDQAGCQPMPDQQLTLTISKPKPQGGD